MSERKGEEKKKRRKIYGNEKKKGKRTICNSRNFENDKHTHGHAHAHARTHAHAAHAHVQAHATRTQIIDFKSFVSRSNVNNQRQWIVVAS